MGVEIFGAAAVAAMALMYALQDRSHAFILGFALACVCASLYAFLIRSWPFAIIELVWSVIALHRWRRVRAK